MQLVTADDVRAARARLDGVLQDTPVEPSRALSEAVGAEVVLKCENLQRTGSFKLRGAYNRIAQLDADGRSRGVVCASAGNHAQGVALAASIQGVQATVFMPETAALPKVEATASYGAEVRLAGASFDAALAAAVACADDEGRVFVHPFDHRDIIAGQGTLGLELLHQVPDLGTVVVPIGGGGLCSGIAVAVKDARPDVRVVGVRVADPEATIADGIAVKEPGDLTHAHLDALVDDVVTLDDATIARAVVLLLERAKLVVEPAGAASVAAILDWQVGLVPPVVAVLSGGNIDPLLLHHVVTSGLTAEGRFTTLRTRVSDQPGQLHALLGLLAEERANVVAVEHHRFGRRLDLDEVEVVLELEARGPDHIDAIRSRLAARGYPVEMV